MMGFGRSALGLAWWHVCSPSLSLLSSLEGTHSGEVTHLCLWKSVESVALKISESIPNK